jgi:hypothetical protein
MWNVVSVSTGFIFAVVVQRFSTPAFFPFQRAIVWSFAVKFAILSDIFHDYCFVPSYTIYTKTNKQKQQTPWSEFASELYRPSDRRLYIYQDSILKVGYDSLRRKRPYDTLRVVCQNKCMVTPKYIFQYSVGTDPSDTLGELSLGLQSVVWEPSLKQSVFWVFYNFGTLRFCKIEVTRWKVIEEREGSNMTYIINKGNFFESRISFSNYEVDSSFVWFKFMVFTFMMFGCYDQSFSSAKTYAFSFFVNIVYILIARRIRLKKFPAWL